MDFIQEIFGQISPTTLSLLIVTGSLVLVVLIGGVVSLRKYYNRESGRRVEKSTPTPSQKALQTAIEAYHEQTADEDVGTWEEELNNKLNELEDRFAALAHKLSQVGAVDEDGTEVVRVLAERGMRREDLVPRVAKLQNQGMKTAAIAQQLSLSEEQLKLVQRLAAKQQSEHVVGA